MIKQLSLKGEEIASFKSIGEASRNTGIDDAGIRKVLKGKRASAGGYKWSHDSSTLLDKHVETLRGMSKNDLEALLKHLFEEKHIKFQPSNKKLPKPFKGDPDNILVISDIHAPFTRENAVEFCYDTQKRFNCGSVIFIGDILDNHFSSFHDIDPDGLSALDELEIAKYRVQDWYKVFPKARVCIGNHDALAFRKAFSAGISKQWIKSYNDVLGTEGWEWDMEHEQHGVLFVHGTGSSGEDSALKRAMNLRQPVVQGHIHTTAGIKYNASNKDLIWGFQVGCLVNDKAYAMSYAKNFIKKSVIGCGVVLDKGKLPLFIPMNL